MFCPLCNGMDDYRECCSACGATLMDCGRLADWTGPYAPYGPIDEEWREPTGTISEINASADCHHIVYCRDCQATVEVLVAEWR